MEHRTLNPPPAGNTPQPEAGMRQVVFVPQEWVAEVREQLPANLYDVRSIDEMML